MCREVGPIQALSPFSEIFGEFNVVSTFSAAYGADLDDLIHLSHELHQTKHLLQKMKIEDRPTAKARFISDTERYGDAIAELQCIYQSAQRHDL
jgi:hypothetical protein